MVCDRRILEGGWWHIRRARGDLAGDVHRGCAVARNVEGERETYTFRQGERDGEIKEQYIMEFTSGVPWWLYRKQKKKKHMGNYMPAEKWPWQCDSCWVHCKKQGRVEILRRVLILYLTVT